MITHTETVAQSIDGALEATFTKDVVLVRAGADRHRLAMVRKRLPPPAVARGAVILVHGFGQNRYSWHLPGRSFSGYLAAAGWDVFNLDLRGHGRSRHLGAPRPRLLDEYVYDDIPAFVDEAMRLAEVDSVTLIGHSMGGLVCYAAAGTSILDRVRGIITIGSPYRWGLGSRVLATLATVLSAARTAGLLAADRPFSLHALGRQLRWQRRLWDTPHVPLPMRAWVPGSVEALLLDQYLDRAFDLASLQVAFDIFRFGTASAPHVEVFEALDLPLLVIAGEEDRLAPPASVRPAYERSRSSDRAYRAFPLGHIDLIVGRDAPRIVWPAIASWLERH